jgi:lactaldehyde reductase
MANRIVLNPISYHGRGAIESIVPEVKDRGFQKAFVCSDPDLVKFGVTAKVTAVLDKAGMAYGNLLGNQAEPHHRERAAWRGRVQEERRGLHHRHRGGSSMDTAKAVGIIINNPEFADVRSLEGVAPTKRKTVFTIAVPTTAGTRGGSDHQLRDHRRGKEAEVRVRGRA